MRRIFLPIALAMVLGTPAIANASYTFDFAQNAKFLSDLNSYTTIARSITYYGKEKDIFPDRTGRPVVFIGRGAYDPSFGGSGYAANYVIVGTPCLDCTPQIMRYHTNSEGAGIDEIIAVYPR
ncbi:MAG TPA: hypothetical protein VFL98_00010 [Candidatus Paceibacterota bacterium]|nr:hypothetical protein [Candidatus Paceibacterota bacterium]